MDAGKSKELEFIEDLGREIASKKLIFPTSLNTTLRIRSALNAPNASIHEAVQIVRAEPVLCAQLLRLANAVVFNNGGRPITDLSAAICRLGYVLVKNVATAVAMRQLAEATPQKGMQPRLEGVWKHSLLVAALSYSLAKKLAPHLNPDSAMLAGLLHNIGKFYILARARHYPAVFANETAMETLIHDWHTEISRIILEGWETPEKIAAAVRDHELVNRAHSGLADLTDVVMSANILASLESPCTIGSFNWAATPAAFEKLGLDAENCVAILQDAKEEAKQITQALS